jgi:hypothetical protein
VRANRRQQMGGIAEPVFVPTYVTWRIDAQAEPLYSLIGIIPWTEVHIHYGFSHLFVPLQVRGVSD